ncbi:Hypothetical protein NTJ_09009 [Nesidiocoris tenuis]|uniref:Uncharacterized protein n=1 Tax=Nesidiocoris tenuis TaxID=355587 RepID=A0ABN7AVI9_9HEMI|nr:Hypothetical protein NTJ_09009 [Nesidiocoris tenuis]
MLHRVYRNGRDENFNFRSLTTLAQSVMPAGRRMSLFLSHFQLSISHMSSVSFSMVRLNLGFTIRSFHTAVSWENRGRARRSPIISHRLVFNDSNDTRADRDADVDESRLPPP